MTAMTVLNPRAEPIQFKRQTNLELKTSKGAVVFGVFVVIVTLILYVLFSPLVFAK
jgi:uncharacterized sodium:solute symporter family permease YidK